MVNRSKTVVIAVLFLIILNPAIGATDESLNNLANKIAEKRARVEALSSELDMVKTEYNEKLKSISSQKSDIDIQVKREELKLIQVERDFEEFRLRIEDSRASMDEIYPIIVSALKSLKMNTEKGLPFHISERVSDIEKVEQVIEDNRIDAGAILARVWNMLEAEFRLTSENGIYRQTIEIHGEEQLVEIAKLGMVFLYFKTFDDRMGYAYLEDNKWNYDYVYSREDENQISELFDSLRKNLREGYFELPNPMAR